MLEAAATCEPLHRLTGHAADWVEVPVVVHEHGIVDFGERGDEEVDSRKRMLAARSSARRASPRVERHLRARVA